jgi:hypothetical protein
MVRDKVSMFPELRAVQIEVPGDVLFDMFPGHFRSRGQQKDMCPSGGKLGSDLGRCGLPP